jgi:zinc/manganese transport system substrate-binding protein
MRNLKTVVTVAAILGSLVLTYPAQAEMKVVATVPDLAAVAKEVGGQFVSVKSMVTPMQDPHFADAKPSLVLDLNKANLVLLVGLDLEVGWLPTLLVGARNPQIHQGAPGYLDCSQFVRRLDVPTQAVDRSMGDIHPGGNPHYMMDPRAAVAVARGIGERMARIDPGHAEGYRANVTAFVQRIDAARVRWEQNMRPHRGVPFIEYHKTLTYLADWLGLQEAGSLEPKPGIPPSPSQVASLLSGARLRKVRALIIEDRYPESLSRLLAQKIPAALIRIPGATNFQGGQTYGAYIDEIMKRLVAGLSARR